VGAVDVAPTLLALVHEQAPDSMQGNLLPGLGLNGRPESKPVYVHCGDQLVVRVGWNKLITSRNGAYGDEVYDLRDDPAEKKNALGKDRAADELLRTWARSYWGAGSADASKAEQALPQLDEKTKERLRALGYLE
jgi:hypothetical protein